MAMGYRHFGPGKVGKSFRFSVTALKYFYFAYQVHKNKFFPFPICRSALWAYWTLKSEGNGNLSHLIIYLVSAQGQELQF